MISRHSNIWKWLQPFPVGLMLVAVFAPLPEPVAKILWLLAAVLVLAYLGAGKWEERRRRRADQSSSAAISSNDQT